MRTFIALCTLISGGLATTASEHSALQEFIANFGIYPSEEMPKKLPRGLRGFTDDLSVWVDMKMGEFIEKSKDDIILTHEDMLAVTPLRVLLKVQLDAMAAQFDNEEQRIVEFAKIYRRALRNLEDFN